MLTFSRRLPVALILAVSAHAPDAIGAAAPGALARLEPGQWELQPRDTGEPTVRICLGDPLQFTQPRHSGEACQRTTIRDTERDLDVSYQCRGSGHGRTMVRVETERLAQVTTQGVRHGMPFSVMYEARRVGPCSGRAGG